MNLHGDFFPLSIFQGLCHSQGRISLVLGQSSCCPLPLPIQLVLHNYYQCILYLLYIHLHSLNFTFSFLHILLLWNLIFVEFLLCFHEHLICVNYCHPSYYSIISFVLHITFYLKSTHFEQYHIKMHQSSNFKMVLLISVLVNEMYYSQVQKI